MLANTSGEPFEYNVQGFGIPDLQIATQSTRWRVCYLAQGSFNGSDPNEFHKYKFLFPNNADKVTVTFVVGKPSNSEGCFKYKLVKSGNKLTSKVKPNHEIGKIPVETTYKATYDVKRGGNGEWTFEIYPFFDKNMGTSKSLDYGCVVTVESTKNLDIYTPIKNGLNQKSLWCKKLKRQ